MSSEWVEERNGGLFLQGSRVSLASLIYAFQDGESPETIRQNFPSLSLAQVYGAIAFYLSHPDQSRTYLESLKQTWDKLERSGEPPNAELTRKLESAGFRSPAGHTPRI
jgi:uncharacterized protein (DUF433 family)